MAIKFPGKGFGSVFKNNQLSEGQNYRYGVGTEQGQVEVPETAIDGQTSSNSTDNDVAEVGDDASMQSAWTFTVGKRHSNKNFILRRIRLQFYEIGVNGGDLTVAIQDVDGSNKPAGTNLATAKISHTTRAMGTDAWLEANFEEKELLLEKGKQYYIVCSAPDSAGASDSWWINWNAFIKSDGEHFAESTDGGSSWGAPTADYQTIFEILGIPTGD